MWGVAIDPPIKSIRARGVRLDSSIIYLWQVWLYKTAVVGASLPWLFLDFCSLHSEWWQEERPFYKKSQLLTALPWEVASLHFFHHK